MTDLATRVLSGILSELAVADDVADRGSVTRVIVDYAGKPPASVLGALFDPVQIVPEAEYLALVERCERMEKALTTAAEYIDLVAGTKSALSLSTRAALAKDPAS